MAGLQNSNNPFQSQVRLGPSYIQLVPGPKGDPGGAGGSAPTGIGFWYNSIAGTMFAAASIGTSGQVPVTQLAAGSIAWSSLTGDVTLSAFVPGQAQVLGINGASVATPGGALATGNVLQVTSLSSLGYGPVALGGGANYVSGLLPAANQASQVMGGDVTGITSAAVVAGIQTKPVPAPSGTATLLTWNAGGSGLFSWATSAGSITFGGDLTGTSTVQNVVSLTGPAGAGGTIPLGDGTHSFFTKMTTSLQPSAPSWLLLGSTGFSAAASAGSAGGTISIASGTGGAGQGTNMAGGAGALAAIAGGAGGAATGTSANSNGGDLFLSGGTPGTGGSGAAGVAGNVWLRNGTVVAAFVTANASGPGLGIGTTPGTDPTLTRGTGVPATTQPNGSLFLRSDGNALTAIYSRQSGAWVAVGASATVTWADDMAGSTATDQWVASISGNGGAGGTIVVNAGSFTWGKTQSAAGLTQSAQSTDVATNNLLLRSQGPWASAVTHVSPGNILLDTPAFSSGAAITSNGHVLMSAGGVTYLDFAYNPQGGNQTWIDSPNAWTMRSTGSYIRLIGLGDAYFDADLVHYRTSAGTEWLTVTPSASAAITFGQGVTAGKWTQAQQANGSAPSNLTISPQAPGAAATNATNGTPASLFVNVAAPVNGGADAGLAVQRNGVTYAQLGPFLNAPTQAALYLGNGVVPSVGSGANHTIQVVGSANSYTGTVFNAATAGSTLYLRVGGASAGFALNSSGLQIGSETFSLGGGTGVIGLSSAAVNPSSNPTGGAIIYSKAGTGQVWIREAGGANFQVAAGSLTLPVTVPNGGTGVTTLTAHGVLIGEGTGNVVATSAGTAGQLLQSGGAGVDPGWTAWTHAAPGASGNFAQSNGTNWTSAPTLGAANGGTGQATLTTHAILIGNGSSGVNIVAAAALGKVLRGNGTSADPVFSAWTMDNPSTSGQVLTSDGTNWVSTAPVLAKVAETTLSTTLTNSAAVFTGTVTVTTLTGQSVRLSAAFKIENSDIDQHQGSFTFSRGGSSIGQTYKTTILGGSGTPYEITVSMMMVDAPTAGTYTYGVIGSFPEAFTTNPIVNAGALRLMITT